MNVATEPRDAKRVLATLNDKRFIERNGQEYTDNKIKELKAILEPYYKKAKEFERFLQENGIDNKICYEIDNMDFYVENIPESKYVVFLQAYKRYISNAFLSICPVIAKFLVI